MTNLAGISNLVSAANLTNMLDANALSNVLTNSVSNAATNPAAVFSLDGMKALFKSIPHFGYGILYAVLAPVIGGLLAGIDRIITARMQRRVGPPLFQPFYDVLKLFSKETVEVNPFQVPFIFCHLFFMIMTGAFIFGGMDILLIFFVFTVSSVFLVLGAYSSSSPFSHVGAERELILIMAYEPMVLLTLVGFYKAAGSFHFYDIIAAHKPLILLMPGMFLGFVYILTIKLRKSPFDLSYSHHAHQELVKGFTTDLSGKTLAMIEITHWYETVLLMGIVYLFFSFNPLLGAGAMIATYFAEILIDNVYARFKWELVLASSWIVALIAGGGNLVVLYLIMRG